MAEIVFADGKQVVDDIYVGPINKATNGSPQGFTLKAAMQLVSQQLTKQALRDAQSGVISRHFRHHGGHL